MRNLGKEDVPYGAFSENYGSVQKHGLVSVLSAAGLQKRHSSAHQERRRLLRQCSGSDGRTGQKEEQLSQFRVKIHTGKGGVTHGQENSK